MRGSGCGWKRCEIAFIYRTRKEVDNSLHLSTRQALYVVQSSWRQPGQKPSRNYLQEDYQADVLTLVLVSP